jgi:hypothetical protein
MAWAFMFTYAASFAVIEIDVKDEVSGIGVYDLVH